MAKTAAQPKTMESNHKVASVLSTGLFAILCVLIAFPLLAGFFASFQEGREVVMKGMSLNLDFSKMHLDNYKYLFSGNEDSRKYFMWYKNSLILTLITVVLTLLVCYFIAYGLTMYKFKLQGFLFFLVIATMCVPFEILMLPLYNEVTISLGSSIQEPVLFSPDYVVRRRFSSLNSTCRVFRKNFWMQEESTDAQSMVSVLRL